MINHFYKNRYEKFINTIRGKQPRDLIEYTETHHILPRCLHGTNDPKNLIELTLREHFLAHWLLWKAYPDYLPLASAFLQMNNKNSELSYKGFQGRITSRTYASLKTKVYDLLKIHTVGWVYVKDEKGCTVKLSKSDYESQNDFKFHTTGKIYVLDVETNKWVYISTELYHSNKDRYKSRMSLEGFPYGGKGGPGDPNASIDVVFSKYQFLDLETKEIIKITKTEARQKNKEYGYKRLKHIQKKNVKCIDENGNFYSVPLEDYDPVKHKFYLSEKVNIFDTIDNTQKIISLTEYYLNKTRYITSTKGKVLAKDSTGKNVLISKEEFKSGNYVGQTKGLRTVKNIDTGQFVQISEDEYLNNKEKYVGPNQGKINVIDKITGERKQISKDQFDTNRYCGLGNKKFLFLCQNKLTNKEKYINIYEWNLVKDTYVIIDKDKFQKILDLLQ